MICCRMLGYRGYGSTDDVIADAVAIRTATIDTHISVNSYSAAEQRLDCNVKLDQNYVIDQGATLYLFASDYSYSDEVVIDIASATSDGGWNYTFNGIPTDKELRLKFNNVTYGGVAITLPDVFTKK